MGLGPDVPENVLEVFQHFGDLRIPTNQPKEIREIYERGRRGQCMTCEGNLGSETIVIVSAAGINQIYCSHKCNQDMNVMGWILQAYDDLKQGVEFRGDPTGADVEPDDEQPELPAD